jgi:predicted nucleic acid-binding protein
MERRGLTMREFVTTIDDRADISSITASELLMGLHRAATEEQRAKRRSFIDAVLLTCDVHPFDFESAEIHARVWAQLASSGQMIGQHDLIIAATALANGYAVLTENVREFERVPGLEVRRPDW